MNKTFKNIYKLLKQYALYIATTLLLIGFYLFTRIPVYWVLAWLIIFFSIPVSNTYFLILYLLAFVLDITDITRFGLNILTLSFTILANAIFNYILDFQKDSYNLIKIISLIFITILVTLICTVSNKFQIFSLVGYIINFIITGLIAYCIIMIWTKLKNTLI